MDMPEGVKPPPTFALSDADGREHQYVVSPHPASEGDALAWQIQSLGTQALVEAVRTIAGAPEVQRIGSAMKGEVEVGEDEDLISEAMGGVLQALAAMDTTALGKSLQDVLGHPRMPEIARKVMVYTVRDGQPLRQADVWAKAYQANYGEMMMAVGRVIQINDFFPVARLFSALPSSGPS